MNLTEVKNGWKKRKENKFLFTSFFIFAQGHRQVTQHIWSCPKIIISM